MIKYLTVTHFNSKITQSRYKFHGAKFVSAKKIAKYFTVNIEQYRIPKYGNRNNENWMQRYRHKRLFPHELGGER